MTSIKVEVISNVLGTHVFWEGDASKIKEIRNIVARGLAEIVVKDKKNRKDGMWRVSVA